MTELQRDKIFEASGALKTVLHDVSGQSRMNMLEL